MKHRTLCHHHCLWLWPHLVLLWAVLQAFWPAPARAATFNIANGDVPALKSAIATANTNNQDDAINLAANGTYTLTAVDNTAFNATGLPVLGNDSGHALTINGNGATVQRSSASGTPDFRVLANSGANVALNGLSIANGKTDENGNLPVGGGLYNAGALTLTDCTVSGNHGHYGGGLGNDGTLTLHNCTINSNSAVFGGGIDNEVATLTVTGCTLAGNSSVSVGAGIFHKAGTATVTGSNFSSNNGALGGGGIYNYGDSGPTTMTVSNCTFTGNLTNLTGGGIGNEASTLTVTGSTFTSNGAHGGGGAIDNEGSLTLSALSVTNSAFTSNAATSTSSSAFGSGGGIASGTVVVGGKASLAVTGCTFTFNAAQGSGGGIISYRTSGSATVTATVKESTFTRNSAQFQGGGLCNSRATATVRKSTFDRNQCNGLSGYGSSGLGGGLSNEGSAAGADHIDGSLTLQNCTLSQNLALLGGGVGNSSNGGSASVTAQSCTFSSNDAFNDGGAISSDAANSGNSPVTLGNNILKLGKDAGTAANLTSATQSAGTAPIVSQGYNLCEDGGSGFLTATGDQIFTDPDISGALQSNGGPTQTIKLSPFSPAVDKGKAFGLSADQRDALRPSDDPGIAPAPGGDNSDIGAYELSQTPQSAPNFLVNAAADYAGVCTVDDCTLREAVDAANATAGADTILFAANLVGTIGLTQGELDVTDAVTIDGPGARVLTVTGNATGRVFAFTAGNSVVENLTIQGGKVTSVFNGSVAGGGIFNQATLVLRDCTLSDNQALGGSAFVGGSGGAGSGGAIANAVGGALTLNRCAFIGNSAIGGRGSNRSRAGVGHGGAALGGAVFNAAGATLNITNCTFSGNTANGGAGGNDSTASGGSGGNGSGALFNQGTMTVTNSTVSGNTGTGGAGGQGTVPGLSGQGLGGIVAGSASSSTIRSTISAGNTANSSGGRDVDGAFTSQGFNLIGSRDHSTGFTAATDQTGTDAAPLDAKLGVLHNNGGPTDTMALFNGSLALDQGNSFGVAIDQRSKPRPVDSLTLPNATGGDGSDIGAFEAGPIFFAPPSLSVGNATLVEGSAGSANMVFIVTRNGDSSGTSTVHYATADGTAKAGIDYSATSGTLSVNPDHASATIVVPILGDALDEPDKTFKLNLSSPSGATIAAGTGVGTIEDDDPAPHCLIDDVTVVEGNGGTVNAVFHLTLSAASGRTVTVTYKTTDGTATAPADYTAHPSTTLTFTPGQTSKTITVGVKGDTLDEANETFKVVLQSATFAAIVDDKGVGTITDNDALPSLSISDAPAKAEGDSGPHNALFTVTLTPASGRTVTVNYATANGTATADSDYLAAAGTLTFLPGQTSKTFPVQVLGDTTVEPDESFKVNLSGAGFATISDSQGVHTITNDDASE